MSKRPVLSSRLSVLVSGRLKYLIIPCAVAILALSVAFRPSPLSTPENTLSTPLMLPAGWQAPPVPANNPITQEKFDLGRQLFYETALSGDNQTSCGSCHNSYLAFGNSGPHIGANQVQSEPARSVPRLMNVGYDTVLTWDGHIQTLEEQVTIAVQKKGDLEADTTAAFSRLANNPAYIQMFTAAFGDGRVTLDRISKAIATFERCLISGSSKYDDYMNGNSSAMSASAVSGMNLFFDTTKTNCSECHNNLGARGNAAGNIFTDNGYYRTGTFESVGPGIKNGGYGLDTTGDTLSHFLDAGRAAVTRDTVDIGRFRTPSLRNVALKGPYGADGTVTSLEEVIANYNAGGIAGIKKMPLIPNKDPRIQPLNLDSGQMTDLTAFLNSLTDLNFISDQRFQDPGQAILAVDDHILTENLSLYPNPAPGYTNVDCPVLTGSVDAALISESGTTVWHKTVSSEGKLHLDFSGIANGSYRLRLNAANVRRIVPIVLAR